MDRMEFEVQSMSCQAWPGFLALQTICQLTYKNVISYVDLGTCVISFVILGQGIRAHEELV